MRGSAEQAVSRVAGPRGARAKPVCASRIDTTGSGHSWRLTDGQPWRRAYVILAPGVAVPFTRSAA